MTFVDQAIQYEETEVERADLPLERDVFLRTLISELSGILQDVVGVEEASGFVSIVGRRVGDQINEAYKSALHVDHLSHDQVARVLVDLKKRINGKFFIIEQTPEKIVFGNTQCPFLDKVIGKPSMCMMTSNVFGAIAAQNLGYSRVSLEKTIAAGDAGCRVVVYLKPSEESQQSEGREYFGN